MIVGAVACGPRPRTWPKDDEPGHDGMR